MDHAERILKTHWPQCSDVRWLPVSDRHRFSGALLWRISTATGDYCLRRWPVEADPGQLGEIHRLLRHAASQAIDYLPQPIAGTGGTTLFYDRGHWWELTAWLPGEATFCQAPSEAKLRAAAGALARFHQAVAEFPTVGERPSCSPGLRQRAARLRALRAGGAVALRAQLGDDWPVFTPLAVRMLEYFERLSPGVDAELRPFCDRRWVLQPCIRDIWHQHVLFRGLHVTGIVDFGAMARDHIATDLARLFGSMIEDDPAAWESGFEAYSAIRPLSSSERQLVRVFDRANVVLSGLQWIDWIYVQQRTFRDPEGVLERCQHFLRRLGCLQQNLG